MVGHQPGGVPDRVRRPADRALLVLALAALAVVVLGVVAASRSATGLDQGLTRALDGLPRVVLSAVSIVGGLGAVLLPVAHAVDLGRRGRLRFLPDPILAAATGALLAALVETVVGRGVLPRDLVGALTQPVGGGEATSAVSEVVVATCAFLVAMTGGALLVRLGAGVVLALGTTAVVGGDSTLAALLLSGALGVAVGAAVRVGVGRPATMAPLADVLAALGLVGPATGQVATDPPRWDGVRRLRGTAPGLVVDVWDRDAVGAGLLRRSGRYLLLRPGAGRGPEVATRAQVEHALLMSYALADAGVAAPRVVRAADVGGDSLAVAWTVPDGVAVPVDGSADPASVVSVWRLLRALRAGGLAHRALGPETVLVDAAADADDPAALTDVGRGDVASPELAQRLDVAAVLAFTALASDAPTAVRHGIEAVGLDAVRTALPVLQPIALPAATRAALRERPGLLTEVQQAVLDASGETEPPPETELRRVTPRTVLSVVGGGVAGYLLLGQLSRADLVGTVLGADLRWVAGAVGFAALTFAGASLTLVGASPVRLRLPQAALTQLAIAFVGLVAPAMLGNVALNSRLLRRAGAGPGASAGALGLIGLTQFGSYSLLLAASAVAAGVGPRASFTPSPVAVVLVLAAVAAGAVALALPSVRGWLARRFLPELAEVLPAVVSVLRRPAQVVRLVGGALLLDASFVAALFCATRAVGAETPVASVAVVYFAGAIIGSAVPTPGGLGGIEAAMTAGLVAVGTAAGPALSAVLLYRVATYWLPIPLGWAALHRLQRARVL
ncbi:lysylphosphatidylglycerol synthase transmembrane domain-containing protein [Phycicoccus flavus]|uniref:Flippase-like domain-containing protein n=1 Tax=Phycicoccus flavus TaxID=2502783 RepID=A0A8T6R084_9MICO|nr:lysylphosphatidylglycerol synthase transmembrane domain-containing protein [Phycicoccus flavus]NHA67658.1 flippase-like domain-containing protein [Phycicoccus flavus]